MGINEKMTAIADNIRSKTGERKALTLDDMASGINDVFEAGKKSVVDESKIIEKTVSGTNVVFLDDVSEISHSVKVTTNSDVVKQYGKNIFNPTLETKTLNGVTCTKNDDNTYTVNGTATAQCSFGVGSLTVIPGLRYYVSGGTADLGISWQKRKGTANLATLQPTTESIGINATEEWDNLNCMITVKSGTTVKNLTFKPMVSLFKNSIYEPCKLIDYTDVEGEIIVPNFYPYMTLIADAANAILTVTYNQSYGMKREYDRFWDEYQDYGKRRDYNYSFAGNMWDDAVYNPKYEIIIDNNFGTNLFRGNRQFTDTKVPIRVLSKGTSYVFNNCENLKRIPLLEVVEDLAYTGWFSRCSALVEITIMGTIGNDISFADCLLLTSDCVLGKVATVEQIAEGKNIFVYNDTAYYGGIFGALKDFSNTTTTATIILHNDVKTRLNNDYPGAIDLIRAKGWTVA